MLLIVDIICNGSCEFFLDSFLVSGGFKRELRKGGYGILVSIGDILGGDFKG